MRSIHPRAARPVAALVALVLGAAGCGDGGTDVDPAFALAAGSYSAEGPFGAFRLTTREEGSEEVVDWLERGASVLLELHPDGTTSGRLFVPGADEDGGDLDQDLTGTFTVEASVVELAHEADTFLRDMSFVLDDQTLSGTETFSGTTLELVLTRRAGA